MKTHHSKSKIHGFTLIEFLVASSLAVIVIMAASSTYFITRKLGQSAQEKINVQNNLRNAATLITRDARSAGSFGCFSTGGVFSGAAGTTAAHAGSFPVLDKVGIGVNSSIRMNNTSNSGYGVIWTNDLSGFNLPSGAGGSHALIFIYGKGNVGITKIATNSVELINSENADIRDTVSAKGPLVLSSCENAITLTNTSGGKVVGFDSIALSNEMQTGDLNRLSVSKLYAAAYLVGDVNGGGSALLRYEMDAGGKWSNPQILSKDVSKMDVSFAYEQNCDVAASIPSDSMKFKYSNNLAHPNLPALIQMRLTYAGSAQTEYIINAGVRGGNQCTTQIAIQ